MAEYIYMPKLGLTMIEGYLVKWEKKEGDAVNVGDVLFTVENNKAAVDIESKKQGVLRKILVVESETVPVGTPVGIMAGSDEDISSLG
jgi:pyruvate dehydrogenase E2 component (dihydrolipoamide acetyltransferase)